MPTSYVKNRLANLHATLGRGAASAATPVEQELVAGQSMIVDDAVGMFEQLPTNGQTRIVVIGLSMVGFRFCEKLLQQDTKKKFELV
eukprot:SAG31_NODE_15024_length_775_cov_0.575444_1_plen_86_part_01